MRAIPGRQARTRATFPAAVTRASTHNDQRARILRALAWLVAAEGYADVTVKQIVKRAHVSHKTFYERFHGKEEAFVALFDSVVATTEVAIVERLELGPSSWAERVVTALRALVDRVRADPVLARVVIVDAPGVSREMLDRHQAAIKGRGQLFSAGRELNPRGAELPITLEDTLVGSVYWSVYHRLLAGEADRLADVLPEMIEVVLRPYLGQPAAGRFARAQSASPPIAG